MILKRYPLKILEKKHRQETNVKIRERLQILIFLREGYPQRDVSHMLRLSIGTVPFWKKRFEKEGLDGLQDKKGRGIKSKLNQDQLDILDKEVEGGIKMPDGYRRGMKTKDAKSFIKEKFGVIYTNRHCQRILRRLNFRLKVPRPRHKRRNQSSVEDLKKNLKKTRRFGRGYYRGNLRSGTF